MSDLASPLTFLLHAWRLWVPAAIADGTAMPHFKASAKPLLKSRWRPCNVRGHVLRASPSIPALASGWPADNDGQLRFMPLLYPTTQDELRELARSLVLDNPGYAVFMILAPAIPPGCPDELPWPPRARRGRGLRCKLPRARALATVLAKTTQAIPPTKKPGQCCSALPGGN